AAQAAAAIAAQHPDPAPDPVLVGGLGSMGVDRVNSSIGSQGKPVARVLEQAVLAIPVQQRAGCRLRIQAVLTASRPLARDLRHGRAALEPRSAEQVAGLSPRAPPWTPAQIAADITTAHHQAAIPLSTPAPAPAPRSHPEPERSHPTSSWRPSPPALPPPATTHPGTRPPQAPRPEPITTNHTHHPSR
ncbi:MAG: hypothetical protein Q4C85_07405, partial [Actinomyces sp.]|nr:hypothetical protein [Actinomyces sp.]